MPEKKRDSIHVRAENLTVKYGNIQVVKNVSFAIPRGKTMGLVGESGCGKSTLGKAVLHLLKPSEGKVYVGGQQIFTIRPKLMQMVFQDPYACLNPKLSVEQIIAEGIDIHDLYRGVERSRRIHELLESVKLPTNILKRRPTDLSGGQRQRIGIARALAVEPSFIFCDEPTSSLDTQNQAEIVELLLKVQEKSMLSYLFVAHDLPLVTTVSDEVAVMYLGTIVEQGTAKAIATAAKHPYSQALLSAVPTPDPRIERKRKRIVLKGEPPSPAAPPKGCPFHPRCLHARDICRQEMPTAKAFGEGHWARCHFV